jgi:solute carrier family 35 protein E3
MERKSHPDVAKEATVSSLDANLMGTLFGTLGVFSTSFYQIWVKSEQQSLKLNPQQLLHNQAFVSFWLLLVVAPFLEDVWGTEDSLLAMNWFQPETLAAVLFSACLAFLVNLSIFLVIGKTSAVSYNVLGHAKLCCILTSGYLLFGETATAKNVAGVLMAVVGIVSYTDLKIKENKAKEAAKK